MLLYDVCKIIFFILVFDGLGINSGLCLNNWSK